MTASRRTTAAGLVLAVVLAAAAGCQRGAAVDGRDPAGPAAAPPTTVSPVGTVVALPRLAGGMVADERTGLVVVGTTGPARLAFVDGRTGEVRRSVPLPGTPGQLSLAAAGGPVLVPTQSADGFVQIALPTGDLVSRTIVGHSPTAAAAAADGKIFVANATSGTVSVVDSEKLTATLGGFARPSAVATTGMRVAALDPSTANLTVYDAAGLTKLASLPAGAGPTRLIADRHSRLVVVDTRGAELLIFDVSGKPALVHRLPLPGAPYAVAYDRTRDLAWVTLTATNEVVAVDLADANPQVVARIPTVRQPDLVAVDSGTGRVFVGSPASGQLQLVDR